MKIEIDQNLSLTEVRNSDVDSLVEHLNDESIHRFTLTIPYPYAISDAEKWLEMNRKLWVDRGTHSNFAIRNGEELVGVIGFLDLGPPNRHRAEVGYWLAKPLQGRGIMSRVLKRFAEYAFQELGLSKLTAVVFAGNGASEKVLRNNGFQVEGKFRSHIEKNDQLLDAIAFGLLAEEWEPSTP